MLLLIVFKPYIIFDKDSITRIMTLMKELGIKPWLNYCCFDNCEFGVFSNEFTETYIGVSFLSILSSFHDGVKSVQVLNPVEGRKYVVGFRGFKIVSLNLDNLGIGIKDRFYLGYSIASKSLFTTKTLDISGLQDVLNEAIRRNSLLEERQNILLNLNLSCRPVFYRLKKTYGLWKGSTLFYCNSRRDYENLLKIIFTMKTLSGLIFGAGSAIVKPAWRTIE